MRSLLPAGKILAFAGLFLGLSATFAQVPGLPTPTVPGGVSNTSTATDASQVSQGEQPQQLQQAQQSEQLDYSVPPQAPVTPNISHEVVDSSDVYTVHLRPLYTTGIRLPEEVTSLAVGAPTLIAAEHDKNEPDLIFVKPTTESPVDSDVLVALKDGKTLAIHVISPGDKGSDAPVDFMVDFSHGTPLFRGQAQTTLLRGSSDGEESAPTNTFAPGLPQDNGNTHKQKRWKGTDHDVPKTDVTDSTPVTWNSPVQMPVTHPSSVSAEEPRTLLESSFDYQVRVGAPHYVSGSELAHLYPEDAHSTSDLEVALGRVVQQGDTTTFSFSVMNTSHRQIEIMPPLLQFADPNGDKKAKQNKKHPASLAEQLTVDNYLLSSTNLTPGQRVDGVVQFQRPDFKFKKQTLMLQIASAAEVDTALLVPVPFIPQKEIHDGN